MEHLERFQVDCGPARRCYYIPDFITVDEETYLIRKIYETPQQKWKTLAKRRLQTWGGEIDRKSNVLIPSALPSFLTEYPNIISRISETGIFKDAKKSALNHVIINEYLPGQGIMPHEDGPSYYPAVATISLGSHTVMHYHQYKPSEDDSNTSTARPIDPTPILSLLLEPRSLIITTDQLYTTHLHAIEPLEQDEISPGGTNIANKDSITSQELKEVVERGGTLQRANRVSLTCRVVEKTLSLGAGQSKFGFKR